MKTLAILLFALGTPEIILIVLAILLLFGGKKIPELMKGLGKGVKSFKQGMNEVEKEITKEEKETPKQEEKTDETAK
ncbi:MAG: twin-arginine translocase TatA/TatE family subunit [Sphingobacteriia bacterium]|jgi:sec-independent protein translocase protein TatA|nr:twin-arginine translocase TatA/TatE family subunit [Paludibacteraceae bacterium]NCA78954.1 twin-arginine translocase TatA/TatE family subunit [Sphingobacteriia bacterium]